MLNRSQGKQRSIQKVVEAAIVSQGTVVSNLKRRYFEGGLDSALYDSHQTFTAENGGTRFQLRIELHFRGLARFFGWLILKFGLERHFETAVRELKEELEKPGAHASG